MGLVVLATCQVEHPAARALVQLSQLQDEEVGDGTTSVVVLAAELLKRANELVANKIHPTSVIAGFLRARKMSVKFIAERLTKKVVDLPEEALKSAAMTTLSSKVIGMDSDFFAQMCVDAMRRVKTVSPSGKAKYPVKAINVLKVLGRSTAESQLVDGFALPQTRAAQGMPSRVENAKIALLDFDLRKSKMAFGVQVLIDDVEKLEGVRQREASLTKDKVDMLLAVGANVILTTKGIDDLGLKYFVDAGAIAVRRVSKGDMKRIAKATGGRILLSLADFEGGESVDVEALGQAREVVEERVGDSDLLYIKGCATTAAQTIVLRGPNDYMLDEVERSLHDALCVVKRVLEHGRVVPGGGCCEAALSTYLEHVADQMGSRQQLAIAEFAQALLVIPKCLAVNSALDATELVSKLCAYHNKWQTGDDEHSALRYVGLDLEKGGVRNNLKAGVLEPALSKMRMIKYATEAAITVLRIDDHVRMNKAEKPSNAQGAE
ncbi:MAG: hypothetical protein MHM6MM_002065 [Cercozoa sp. M6MM]